MKNSNTLIEAKIYKIWKRVLGINNFSLTDSFLQLGGNSIFAMEILGEIKKLFQIDLTLNEFLKNSTIEKLAIIVQKQTNIFVKEKVFYHQNKFYKLSPPQKCFTKVGMVKSNNSGCNIINIFTLNSNYSQAEILSCIVNIVNQHDSLRLFFKYRGKELYQYYFENCKNVPLEFIESTDITGENEEQFIRNQAHLFVKNKFLLDKWPLFRIRIYSIKNKTLFFIVAHHLIIDGFGLHLFEKNIKNSLVNSESKSKENLEISFLQYKDFSVNCNSLRKKKKLFNEAKHYWETKFSTNFIPTQFIGTNYNIVKGESLGWKYKKSINPHLVKKIKAFCISHEITTFNFFLSSFCILVSNILNSNNINILVPTLGRPTHEAMHTIGMFALPVVLRPKLELDNSFKYITYLLREDLLDAQLHSSYQLDDLIEFLNIKCNKNKFPITSIVFNQETKQNFINFDNKTAIKHEDTGRNIRFDLQGLIYENDENIILELIYRKDIFLPKYIEEALYKHEKIVHYITDNPEIKFSRLTSLFTQ